MSDRNPPDFQYDVFISYRSADRPWVKDILLKRLEAAGLKVCIDYRNFVPGMPIIRNIRQAMLTSRKTLLILTPAYLDSQWTSFEQLLTQTLDPAGVELRLIPVMKENCELPIEIGFLSHLNFADPEDEGQEWQRLLQALGKPSEHKPITEKTQGKGFRIPPQKIFPRYQKWIVVGLGAILVFFIFQLSRLQLATLFNQWGLQNYRENRLRNALSDYQLAIALDSNHLEAHYNLALLYEDSDRLEEAKTAPVICSNCRRSIPVH